METNKIFSSERFTALFRQSLIVNKKLILISLAGVTGTMFLALLFFQSASDFRNWTLTNYHITFWFFFFIFGIIYCSLSFPAFRSGEKSLGYLTLPASNAEKFIFEFLTRIVAFIILMPLLFWLVANIEGVIIHHYIPALMISKFPLPGVIDEFTNHIPVNEYKLTYFVYGQGGLLILVGAFTSAAYFSKSPLVKMLFMFSIITAGVALYSFLLFKLFNIKVFHPSAHGVLFIHTKHQALELFAVIVTIVNLSLLSIAWFSLKEKEV